MRSVEDKVGSFDVINGPIIVCSINTSLSEEYKGKTPNTMGGTITIPIPIVSITTDIMDIAVIGLLHTYSGNRLIHLLLLIASVL